MPDLQKTADRVELLRQMLLSRYFDEKVNDLYAEGKVHGTAHFYVGQESVAVGAISALREGDVITSTHRGHGHAIAFGLDVDRMAAELLGQASGYCHGKGGSMHIADVGKGMLGANGIVGGGAPAAVGAALSLKLQRRDSVAVCFFGDGALNQGVLHESMNLAAIWSLPVVFVCENNRYAITTPQGYASAGPGVAARGAAYGIPSRMVDGMDVLAVDAAVAEAVARARRGDGPSFLGMETYRFRGHTEGEEGLGWNYRSAEEIEAWKTRDPIQSLERRMLDEGLIAAARIDELRAEVRAEIDVAVAWAKDCPEPELSEVWDDVYA